ncbi:MAG: SDR family NAD(P)-dependent oxidoreductase [Streptococcaceae bacterium]|nr:SDR family NAD(P)-dependent oxidoreductase [Streptococcaceae bacterium]MCL2681012.1 SDR family NAD(P)-dependent oxidoreductase [Streptococcaceae bacterium]MCL2858350.1 SDR family NAD(P)-dependent oxidoreductase [Streptococcaceae bacterium]
MTQRTVVITGASNGMGFEAAKLFSSKGWKVFAGARRVEKIPTDANITALKLDVTDSASNHAFIEEILKASDNHIDVLINNAGYGEYGPAEEVPMENVRKQFETNFFGAVELTQLVLPVMRANHYGRIVNISSVGGDVYTPLGSYYHATKAAMQQWSDVLDFEVQEFGIRSIVVQPGSTQSDWRAVAFDNAEKNLKEDSPYQPLTHALKTVFSSRNSNAKPVTSADLAEVFYKASTDEKIKLRYFNSFVDKLMVGIARKTPKIWRTIVSQMIKKAK